MGFDPVPTDMIEPDCAFGTCMRSIEYAHAGATLPEGPLMRRFHTCKQAHVWSLEKQDTSHLDLKM